MAKQRRGGSRGPELRGTLGTLLRTTFQQAGIVREAIERGARTGRARLDDLRTDRERQQALAELGELVLALIRDGEIDVAELPEAEAIIARLDELDRGAEEARPPRSLRRSPRAHAARDDDDGAVSSSTWRPPTRRAGRETSVWRPPTHVAPPAASVGADPPPRRGGITFDEMGDDDLADYMHPDDIPEKKPEKP